MFSSFRGLRGLSRSSGGSSGDPGLGHDPRRGKQGCLTALANLSVRRRRLLLRGWGSAGPSPPLPPPPPPLLAATAAAASPSPQGRRPGGSAASTFPAPLPPPLPAPPAAAAQHQNSLPWMHCAPALLRNSPIRIREGYCDCQSEAGKPLRWARGWQEVEEKPGSERASGGPMRRAGGRRCASWVEGTGNILKGRVMGKKESQYVIGKEVGLVP